MVTVRIIYVPVETITVTGSGPTYGAALDAARALIPEGYEVVCVTDDD